MVAEVRAAQLDMHARATFCKDGETVDETRRMIAGYLPKPGPTQQQRETQTVRSASRLNRAFEDGFVEVG